MCAHPFRPAFHPIPAKARFFHPECLRCGATKALHPIPAKARFFHFSPKIGSQQRVRNTGELQIAPERWPYASPIHSRHFHLLLNPQPRATYRRKLEPRFRPILMGDSLPTRLFSTSAASAKMAAQAAARRPASHRFVNPAPPTARLRTRKWKSGARPVSSNAPVRHPPPPARESSGAQPGEQTPAAASQPGRAA